MKARSIFSFVMLVTMASALFTCTMHAQIRGIGVPYPGVVYGGYYGPYYGPYGYVAPAPYYYGAYAGPFRIGGRPGASSGISLRFDGIPGALLPVIENSNVCITGKKVNGCKGAAIAYSSGRGGGHIALPPGTYNVEIRLPSPYSPIIVQDVLVDKGEIVPLALPINNILHGASSARPPYAGSHIMPIPDTKPIPQ